MSWGTSRTGLVVLTTAASILLAAVIYPLWKPLLLAVILAGSLTGLQQRAAARLGHRPTLAALILTIAVVVLIVTPLALLVVLLVREVLDFASMVRQSGSTEGALSQLPEQLQVWAHRALDALPADLRESAVRLRGQAGWAIGAASRLLSTASRLTFQLAIMLIALFFLLRDGYRMVDWIDAVSPLRGRQTRDLLAEVRDVSRRVVGSNLVTGVVQAAVATIGYVIAGAPSPFLFGLMTLLTSFVPSVGTALVALPVVVLLFALGKTGGAIFLFVWALLAVGLVDNVLRPFLIKGKAHLHGALVFFSLLGGIGWLGPMGLVVGPLALAFFLAVMRLDREPQPPAPDAPAAPAARPDAGLSK